MSSCEAASCVGVENVAAAPQKLADTKHTDAGSCLNEPSARAAGMVTPPLKEVTNCTSGTGLSPTPVQDSSAAPTYGNDDETSESYCVNPLFSPAAESSRVSQLAQTPQQKMPQRQWAVPAGLVEKAPETPLPDEGPAFEVDTSAEATDAEDDAILSKLEKLTTEDTTAAAS